MCTVPRQGRSGGGVALLIPIAMEWVLGTDLSSFFIIEYSTESLAIDLFPRTDLPLPFWSQKLVIWEIHRPSRGTIHQSLESLECMLAKLSSEGPIVFIMGDLNINSMDCPNASISTDLLNLYL